SWTLVYFVLNVAAHICCMLIIVEGDQVRFNDCAKCHIGFVFKEITFRRVVIYDIKWLILYRITRKILLNILKGLYGHTKNESNKDFGQDQGEEGEGRLSLQWFDIKILKNKYDSMIESVF
ncbi:hypothetical protein ACJX0J_032257, partial [Zea mays]